MEKALLSRKEAAVYLGLSKNTLAAWATESPPRIKMVKLGSRVMYRKSDLDDFIATKITGGCDA